MQGKRNERNHARRVFIFSKEGRHVSWCRSFFLFLFFFHLSRLPLFFGLRRCMFKLVSMRWGLSIYPSADHEQLNGETMLSFPTIGSRLIRGLCGRNAQLGSLVTLANASASAAGRMKLDPLRRACFLVRSWRLQPPGPVSTSLFGGFGHVIASTFRLFPSEDQFL